MLFWNCFLDWNKLKVYGRQNNNIHIFDIFFQFAQIMVKQRYFSPIICANYACLNFIKGCCTIHYFQEVFWNWSKFGSFLFLIVSTNIAYFACKKVLLVYLKLVSFHREVTGHIHRSRFERERKVLGMILLINARRFQLV